jgi:hypothetical protein
MTRVATSIPSLGCSSHSQPWELPTPPMSPRFPPQPIHTYPSGPI